MAMELLAAICGAITVSCFLYFIMARAAPATDRRLAALVGGRAVVNTYSEDDGRMSRGAAVRAKLRGILPRSMLDRLAAFLVTTGVNAPPETVATVWVLVAIGPVTLYLIGTGGIPQGAGLLTAIAMVALGAYAPLMLLRGRARSRRTKMLRNLPDVMDLLTTCVEAGLGIDAALARVAEKAKEPLAAEIRLVLRTMAMGGTRRDALEQLAARTQMPEINSFTTAVIQAEMMGVSLGQVLRVQSDALRVQRKQRAEQQAFKAPIKIIIVLALFIFPSMFIVILGPAALTIMNSGLAGS